MAARPYDTTPVYAPRPPHVPLYARLDTKTRSRVLCTHRDLEGIEHAWQIACIAKGGPPSAMQRYAYFGEGWKQEDGIYRLTAHTVGRLAHGRNPRFVRSPYHDPPRIHARGRRPPVRFYVDAYPAEAECTCGARPILDEKVLDVVPHRLNDIKAYNDLLTKQ